MKPSQFKVLTDHARTIKFFRENLTLIRQVKTVAEIFDSPEIRKLLREGNAD